jgi:ribosome-associated protein YbcJ (S4-like RNA binding protein)
MDGLIKKAQVFKSIGQNKLLIGGPIEHMILKESVKMNHSWVNRKKKHMF